MEGRVNNSRYRVVVSDDSIAIEHDTDGEIVYWDQQEWIDDPGLPLVIANAIRLAYTQPHKMPAVWGDGS